MPSTNPLVSHSQPYSSLAGRIRAHSLAQPAASALLQGDIRLTYADLETASNRLANWLHARSLAPEARIGVCLARSPRLFVTLLGILKAGAVYVPLDPALPAERLAWLQRDAELSLVLSETDLLAALPAIESVTCINLDDGRHLLSPADHLLTQIPHPQQLAYLIYTSGSTGLPKGVAVAHGALAMHIETVSTIYGASTDDVVLHNIAISFDGASEAWLVALTSGASLVITPAQMLTPAETNDLIRREQVSIVGMSPAYLVQMAEALTESGGSLPVRSYTVGGEAMTREHVALLRQHLKPPRLINGYGPTEAVITPALWIGDETTPEDAWNASAYLPIGRAVGQRSAYVFGDTLEALKDLQAGELYLGGTGLARGYWQRPGLTAERFVPDPEAQDGSRLYRTGDLVRRLANGNLEYLGRLDQQVKIRGLRIELGEIETRLLAQPGVSEASVLVYDPVEAGAGAARDKQLVACIVGTTSVSDLKAALAAQLPSWMVPPTWLVLGTLPRLPSGKLDRQALLMAIPTSQVRSHDFVAPQTVTEVALAALWGELLCQPQPQQQKIGCNDSFFELGGHSLLATRVVVRVRQQWGLELKLADFYAQANLADLASYIDAHTAHATDHDTLDAMEALLAGLES